MMFKFVKKIKITVRILPTIMAVAALKLIFHHQGLEYLTLNPLFSSLLAATTFILGFLISGILSDYKESERLPGDLASSLEAIFDEAYIAQKSEKKPKPLECMRHTAELAEATVRWFHRTERTKSIYERVFSLNDEFLAMEPHIQATYINRLKQEQTAFRKAVTRIHTIRETEFVSSAYMIAEALSFFLVASLIIINMEPFYESMFFTLLVTYLVVYLLLLIKQLDNPFDYGPNCTQDHISLKPLTDATERMNEKLKGL